MAPARRRIPRYRFTSGQKCTGTFKCATLSMQSGCHAVSSCDTSAEKCQSSATHALRSATFTWNMSRRITDDLGGGTPAPSTSPRPPWPWRLPRRFLAVSPRPVTAFLGLTGDVEGQTSRRWDNFKHECKRNVYFISSFVPTRRGERLPTRNEVAGIESGRG